jgi:hypothetical protein
MLVVSDREDGPSAALARLRHVFTEDQITDRQLDELRAAGCAEVFEEHAFGGNRDRWS